MTSSGAPVLVLAAIVSAAAAPAQDAPLDEAVRLAGAYVAQFRANNGDRSIITGTATYGRFRRFQVTVDEKLPR